MSYAGNRLKKVTDRSTTPAFNNGFEFKDGIDLPTEYELSLIHIYYPFGGLMSTSSRQSVQPYKYNGKELETACGVNWYDYGCLLYTSTVMNI